MSISGPPVSSIHGSDSEPESESETQTMLNISYFCNFKLVHTEITHRMLVAIQNTGYRKTVEEVLASLKNDVYNKFKIDKSFGVDIINSDDGEDGDAIQPSHEHASEIFHEETAFYIRIVGEPREDPSVECPVCYAEISRKNVPHSRFHQCGHSMCHRCYQHLRHNVCPMCRAEPREPRPQPRPQPQHQRRIVRRMQDVADYREIENSEVVNIQGLNNEQLYDLLNIQDNIQNNIQYNNQNNIQYNNQQLHNLINIENNIQDLNQQIILN